MRLCHACALASGHVSADAVELWEFPELADRFRVTAVPTVLLRSGNRTAVLSGPLPEPLLLARIAALAAASHQS